MTVVRPIRPGDLAAVGAIYNDAVRSTDATLDDRERTPAQLRAWFAAHGGRYPVVVAARGDRVVGYASLSPFAARGGYLASAEISVYVDEHARGTGVGRSLVAALHEHAEQANFSTVLALVTATNTASRRLFASAGYRENGVIQEIGVKLGRLIDLVVLQRSFAFDLDRHNAVTLERSRV